MTAGPRDSCSNCKHSIDRYQTYARCARTGKYLSREMDGGRCSKGNELVLWVPRNFIRRIILKWSAK